MVFVERMRELVWERGGERKDTKQWEHVGVYMSTRNKRETEREREFGMREKGRGKRKDESKEWGRVVGRERERMGVKGEVEREWGRHKCQHSIGERHREIWKRERRLWKGREIYTEMSNRFLKPHLFLQFCSSLNLETDMEIVKFWFRSWCQVFRGHHKFEILKNEEG